MRVPFHLELIAFSVAVDAAANASAAGLHEDAIVPTSPGQIGINPVDPVTSALGPASQYIGLINQDTDYLQMAGTTTKVRP